MSNLAFLRSIEEKNANVVLTFHPKSPNEKEKKFITFPYPYMNGRLHLGHGYSIMNADLQSRYYESRGFNVLFPFGFHGSGMPIVACAKKLEYELEQMEKDGSTVYDGTQINILKDMGIQDDELKNFVDPQYWVVYFSNMAKSDLIKFQVSADFSRSFFTTDMNPYYDSFVRWQFSHLIKKGYVYKGMRDVIYSRKDKQPCAAHDRHIGEDVKPIKTYVKFIDTNHGKLLVTISSESDVFIGSKKTKFVVFTMEDQKYVSDEWSYENIKHQFTVEFVEYVSWDQIVCDKNIKWIDSSCAYGTGVYSIDKNAIEIPERANKVINNYDFVFCEPNGIVISRSDDKCIVAKTDQWFINYGDSGLKEEVRKYVNNEFTTPDKKVHAMILSSVDWLEEWACSRNFGLGTCIPGTDDLIDSLSDSTIYMAYYTVSHLVTNLPLEIVNNEMWNYIFLNNSQYSTGNADHDEIIERMKKEFNYWYPLDIRVSGKDLIQNHLTMTLFNHQAIWEKYLPRSYYVNGYILLNGEKMSKHTGNFLTINDAVDEYGSTATRFALANNDGIEDGNFESSVATSAIVRLTTEFEWITENIKSDFSREEYNIWDKIFDYEISSIVQNSKNAYDNAKYHNVIKCFYALTSAKDDYQKSILMCNEKMNNVIIHKYVQAFITILYPICPSFITELSMTTKINVNWDITCSTNDGIKYKFYKNILSDVTSECFKVIEKSKKNPRNFYFDVLIFTKFSETEKEIFANKDNFDSYIKTIDKKKIGGSKGFMSYIEKQIGIYGKDWPEWVNSESSDEYDILYEYVPKIITSHTINFIRSPPDEKYMFKHNPGTPKVCVKYEV